MDTVKLVLCEKEILFGRFSSGVFLKLSRIAGCLSMVGFAVVKVVLLYVAELRYSVHVSFVTCDREAKVKKI